MGTPERVEGPESPPGRPRRVAVVIAGAGARGGYEAGVLSVLLPRLQAAGVAPTLLVGTSAGAINVALYAAVAHLPPVQQGPVVLDAWRRLRTGDVFRSPLVTGLGTAGRWAGQLMGINGIRLTGLLDTSPLRRMAHQAANWDHLRSNIDAGLTAVAVVATSGAANRTTVFVDRAGSQPLPPSDDGRAIDYQHTQISPAHVLASAAIPVMFPPVQVPTGNGDPGEWYIDGGVRLNAPLKPALSLGADAVVIVATHPVVDAGADIPHTTSRQAPDVDDTLVRVLDAALVDRMVEDVKTLAKINVLVDSVDAGRAPGVADTSKRPRTVVPYLVVTPADRGTLGSLATQVFDGRGDPVSRIQRLVRNPDMRLLGRLLSGDGSRRGDLLSYLFFDPEFMEASIELGRLDAAAAFTGVAPGDIPWRVGPIRREGNGQGAPEPSPHRILS